MTAQEATKLVAELVRQQAEIKFNSQTLECRCHVVSNVFYRLLKDAGIKAELVAGQFQHPAWKEKLRFGDVDQKRVLSRLCPPEYCYHCWVEINGKAWDLTLTQFEPAASPVSVIPMPDPRYQVRERSVSLETSHLYLELNLLIVDTDNLYDRCRGAFDKPVVGPHLEAIKESVKKGEL